MIKIATLDRTGMELWECLYVVFQFKSARCTKQFANKAMLY